MSYASLSCSALTLLLIARDNPSREYCARELVSLGAAPRTVHAALRELLSSGHLRCSRHGNAAAPGVPAIAALYRLCSAADSAALHNQQRREIGSTEHPTALPNQQRNNRDVVVSFSKKNKEKTTTYELLAALQLRGVAEKVAARLVASEPAECALQLERLPQDAPPALVVSAIQRRFRGPVKAEKKYTHYDREPVVDDPEFAARAQRDHDRQRAEFGFFPAGKTDTSH